jgi:hypothetical protein
MTFPHFGQIVSRDASTFSRLIFRDLGIVTTHTCSTMYLTRLMKRCGPTVLAQREMEKKRSPLV